jgi:lysophospholipase L1-like esterase
MARWHISLVVTGGLLVLLTLTSCSQRDGVRTVAKGDEYVAIGDSYTSAPGTGKSTDDCLQSNTNYPHRVAAKLGLKLTDVSCGFATTEQVAKPQIIGSTQRPPQADALSPSTDLVTISLGANDFNTFGTVAFGCIAMRSEDPSGAPCQEADAAAAGRSVENKVEVTERRLVQALRLIAERAPAARIVVVGYPEFFPKAGPCAAFPLALGDYPFAHRINKLLVRAQQRAAAQANVDYVDVFTASRRHDICAPDPWIAGLHPTRTDASPLHPFPEEQQLVADLLIDVLT